MPRYKAQVHFGPWRAGNIFESEDEWHIKLAAEGRILQELDADDNPVPREKRPERSKRPKRNPRPEPQPTPEPEPEASADEPSETLEPQEA